MELSVGEWIALAHYELLLFAAAFLAVGLLDELAVDLLYVWLRLTGRAQTRRIDGDALPRDLLSGMAAAFIPAWREDAVIAPTLAHALSVWPQRNLRIYVGCYRNDPDTIAAATAAACDDNRVRLVIVDGDGPSSKAHCLNRLYAALRTDELRQGFSAHMVVLHDAEDMVDPAGLPLLDHAIWSSEFVQLPVMALPPSSSRWIASHYTDEFAESHAKAMVVRNALGCAVPGAGVGCSIARSMLDRLATENGGVPFAEESLTEDYELGQRIAALGGRGTFLRLRDDAGRLVATRAFFPARLSDAVRQKTRWTHGIALQGWDRLGWHGNALQRWMVLRDRRGPFAALLLAIAYMLVALSLLSHVATELGLIPSLQMSPLMGGLLLATFSGLWWRILTRALFTAREYGPRQGLLAIPRVLVSNVVAIMSGRRAIQAYIATLRGAPVVWDKTEHYDHPALALPTERAA